MKLKITLVFLLCIFLTCLFDFSIVFGSSGGYTYVSPPQEVIDLIHTIPEYSSGEYEFFLKYKDGVYNVYFLEKTYISENTFVHLGSDSSGIPAIFIENYSPTFITRYNISNNTLSVRGSTDGRKLGQSFVTENCLYMYSSIPIYADGSKETIFFQEPPTVILAPVLRTVEMKEVLKEILGLIPIVMIVVVSYLALRKALQTLVIFLKTS